VGASEAADESAGPGRPACSERAIFEPSPVSFLGASCPLQCAAVGLGSSASLKILVGLMMAV
jgi:hypothetical protein